MLLDKSAVAHAHAKKTPVRRNTKAVTSNWTWLKEADNELLTGSALEVIIILEPFATETFQKEVIFCQFILSINCTNAF